VTSAATLRQRLPGRNCVANELTQSPFVTREALEQADIYAPRLDDMDEPALLRYLTALLELQRRNFYRSPKGEPFSGIGGYALATIVTACNVTQKVFHRWPEDRVGERIAAGERRSAPASRLRAALTSRS
jgi:hypothetical protein